MRFSARAYFATCSKNVRFDAITVKNWSSLNLTPFWEKHITSSAYSSSRQLGFHDFSKSLLLHFLLPLLCTRLAVTSPSLYLLVLSLYLIAPHRENLIIF